MDRDLISILASSAVAIFNPSLLAAVTVMLLLPHPKRLMTGYLLGAYTTSILAGVVVVFALPHSGAVTTSRHTLSPGADILVGVIALAVAVALGTERDARLRSWRERRKQARARANTEKRSWQERMLGRGSAKVTFVVGAAVSFPGVSYLNALHHIVELNPGAVPAVGLVVLFCVMQQLLLELPLLGYLVSAERTARAVARSRAWLARRGRRIAVVILCVIGTLLMIRGIVAFRG